MVPDDGVKSATPRRVPPPARSADICAISFYGKLIITTATVRRYLCHFFLAISSANFQFEVPSVSSSNYQVPSAKGAIAEQPFCSHRGSVSPPPPYPPVASHSTSFFQVDAIQTLL